MIQLQVFQHQSLPKAGDFCSSTPVSELDAAATKIQKVYKSYLTRRYLAECAVVVEELWRKALDFAAQKSKQVPVSEIDAAATKIQKGYRDYRFSILFYIAFLVYFMLLLFFIL